MHEILHRVRIDAPPSAVYEALTEASGLCRWWTSMCTAKPEIGSTATFRFGDAPTGPDMQIVDLRTPEHVQWRCVAGPPEWVGTRLTFRVRPDGSGSVLLFAHGGWKEKNETYMHCNTKWGFFLGISLKKYLEEGRGLPHPEDPDI